MCVMGPAVVCMILAVNVFNYCEYVSLVFEPVLPSCNPPQVPIRIKKTDS